MNPTKTSVPDLPDWARGLFARPLAPAQAPGVWHAREVPKGAISDQFGAEAETYHQRYGDSDHFESLFRSALDHTGIGVADEPVILDLGSGSGVNSVIPCLRLFPGARIVATDLSHALLAILSRDVAPAEQVVCVVMDACSSEVKPCSFDLVTGASILHHLMSPVSGLKAAARALKPGGHACFLEPFEGWGLMRLAYEQICLESDLRGEALDPVVSEALHALIADIAARTDPDPASPSFADLDDKWLMSRDSMTRAATAAGFSEVRFVPHNDHPSLYRDTAFVQLRLSTGLQDIALPDWALAILDRFDRAIPGPTKRLMMLEGSIVLTKSEG